MDYRFAGHDDVLLLAEMNRELTEDEGHQNRFQSDEWFRERMEKFLQGGYQAILFEEEGKVLGYALYRDHPEQEETIYLRQIFIRRPFRRRGYGREALGILLNEIWRHCKTVKVEVLSDNKAARLFYESMGFKEYCVELELDRPRG